MSSTCLNLTRLATRRDLIAEKRARAIHAPTGRVSRQGHGERKVCGVSVGHVGQFDWLF